MGLHCGLSDVSEEFKGWSSEQVIEEIHREEEALTVTQANFADALTHRSAVEAAIQDEQLPQVGARYLARAERIRSLEEGVASQERRLLLPFVSPTQRYITRQVITSLRRSIAALRGWQTREEPLVTRLVELHIALANAIDQIAALQTEITREEKRLEIKRELIALRLVSAKIIIYSVVTAKPPKKYIKRFQMFFNVDAIRDENTGKIDYSTALTQKEIEVCIDKFYMLCAELFHWVTFPTEASTPSTDPKEIETGEWEEIEEAEGCDLKMVSVREDEEETWHKEYVPHELLYRPSEQEKEEMRNRVNP